MWALETMLDDDTNQPNKAGEVYERLYHEEWRTNMLVPTTYGSRVTVRGFLGEYRVRILQGSEVLTELEFTLDQDLEISCTGTFQTSITCSV